jgi:hypothetical protein
MSSHKSIQTKLKSQEFQKLHGMCLELTAVGDDTGLLGLAGLAADSLKGIEHLHAAGHLTEHAMLAIQPVAGDEAHEELRSVGVGAGIGHGEISSLGVSHDEVLIGELHAVDGLTSGTVVSSEITTLGHEIRDDSVEGRALVMEGDTGLALSLLASAKSSEVLSSLGALVSIELHGHSAGSSSANGDIEKHSRVGHFKEEGCMYRNQDIILKQLHCCKVNHTLLCNESIFCVA